MTVEAYKKCCQVVLANKDILSKIGLWRDNPLIYDFTDKTKPCLQNMCWRCERECEPELAHIVPRAREGSNSPGNLILLCHSCHLEQPDCQPRWVQEQWLTLDRERHRYCDGGTYSPRAERYMKLWCMENGETEDNANNWLLAFDYHIRRTYMGHPNSDLYRIDFRQAWMDRFNACQSRLTKQANLDFEFFRLFVEWHKRATQHQGAAA